MIESIIATLGSIASIIALLYQFRQNKERFRIYLLLSIALILSALTAIFWSQNYQLRSARNQASELIKSWLKTDEQIRFASRGELRGVVLSGLAFLEGNRNLFPETYSVTTRLVLEELGAWKKAERKNDVDELFRVKEAAEAMISIITSIQIVKQ